METNQIILIVVYSIGAISNVVIFFIQKAEITKLKSVTEHVERYFKIFNVDELEKYVEVTKKTTKLQVDHAIKKTASKMASERTKEYMSKEGRKIIDEHWNEWKQVSNDRFNELGYYVLALICNAPSKEEREKIIDDFFPVNADIFREHLKRMEEHPEEYKDFI